MAPILSTFLMQKIEIVDFSLDTAASWAILAGDFTDQKHIARVFCNVISPPGFYLTSANGKLSSCLGCGQPNTLCFSASSSLSCSLNNQKGCAGRDGGGVTSRATDLDSLNDIASLGL